jgi:hypothetical protein
MPRSSKRPSTIQAAPRAIWRSTFAPLGVDTGDSGECGSICGPAQGDDREVTIPGSQMRKADRNQALGFGRVQRKQRLELFDFFTVAILQPVQIGELFACRDERGRDGDGAIERRAGLRKLAAISQAESEHVVRFVKGGVELDRLLQGSGRARQASIPARRERELVENLGGMVVEADVALVALGGVRIPPKLDVDVAEPFERPGGAGVERLRGSQVAKGRRQHLGGVPPALVGRAALQIGQHRPLLERNGAAVVLDRHERLLPAHGVVAQLDEAVVILVPFDRLVGQETGRRQAGDDYCGRDELFHPARWYQKRQGSGR